MLIFILEQIALVYIKQYIYKSVSVAHKNISVYLTYIALKRH